MGFDRVQVDAPTFERLIDAAMRGDAAAAAAAIDEMAWVHSGDARAAKIIYAARKRVRGIVDREVAPFPLPVPGHLKGSTLGDPRLGRGDVVTGCMASAAEGAPVVPTYSN